jgi:hypothetical protein
VIRRSRPAVATLALLLILIGAAQLWSAQPLTSARALATGSPIASAAATSAASAPNLFHSEAGFTLTLPLGWSATARREIFNRRSFRHVVISNGPQPATNERGYLVFDDLPADHVVLELGEFSFPGSPAPDTESVFPLDWHRAEVGPDPEGRPSLVLRFQDLVRSLSLVAHFGTAATAADREAVSDLVASVRPDPIPASGPYRGNWVVVGPLASFPIGAVQHFDNPLWLPDHGFYLVRGAHTTFAHIDTAYGSMGAFKPCPIRYEASSKTFVCDATTEHWSRTGAQLGGAGLFGLGYHFVLVKDGLVLVGGASIGGGGKPIAEVDEFSDPIGPRTIATPTRSEVLDRYAQVTTAAPIERREVKLVSRDAALRSDVIRGAFIPMALDRVWVVAFRGDVRIMGGNELSGRWTLFYVDPTTGAAITMACCGPGDWPPGFDALPDLPSS